MIHFLKYSWLYFLISTIVIGIGLFSIIRWGYIYSIDFVGGTNLEYKVNKQIPLNEVRQVFTAQQVEIINLNQKDNSLLIRTKAIDEKKEAQIRSELQKKTKSTVTVLRSETVGPSIGAESLRKTMIAALLAIVGILIYMTFAFKGFNFALAAIIALIHDFFVVIGTYAVLSHFFHAELDTLFVTALLTSMSFSVHDTIIIFDKIREYIRVEGKGDMEQYANKALIETLVRSLNNSITIIFMLLALILLGGSTIRFFAATLMIGTITGSYSSPFIATPLVVWLEKRKK